MVLSRCSPPAWMAVAVALLLAGCTASDPGAYRTFVDDDDASAVAAEDAIAAPPVKEVVPAVSEVPAEPVTSPPATESLAVDEQVKNQQLALASANVPAAAPGGVKLLVPENDIPVDSKLRVKRLTFDDIDLLRVLNMEKVTANAPDYFPDWLKSLHEEPVVLRGWMFPPGSNTGIRRFMFTRDNGTCCFGPNAKIYDKVTVTLRKGETVNNIEGHPFDVTGTWKIEPVVEGEEVLFLYHLEDAHVIEK